jgi:ribose/xylose/arabinose/galactoside ABC-type transport system permease subunit
MDVNWVLALAFGMLVAAVIGCMNAALIGFARFPAILVTLGMAGFLRGIAYWAAKSQTISIESNYVFHPYAFGVPFVLIFFGLMACSNFFGSRDKRLINQHSESGSWSRLSWKLAWPYILSGLMAGLVGYTMLSRLSSGNPAIGIGFELDVVFAVVVGGTCLGKGFGTIIGGILAAFFLITLKSLLAISSVHYSVQQLVIGAGIMNGICLSTIYCTAFQTVFRHRRVEQVI